jgi:Putative Flp pilus-assembly TadE/G-like
MRTDCPRIRGRRGLSLVLTAVGLTAFLGVGALAIDLGMMYKARADALHAAEAGALAGASAFLDFPAINTTARAEAEDRADEFTRRNDVLGEPIGEDDIEIATTSGGKVTVLVRRSDIGTWFARFLGSENVTVAARAAAAIEHGDAVTCLAPFAIPDLWDERTQDINNNEVEDGNERWTFTPTGNQNSRDTYTPWSPPSASGSGYGTGLRNRTPDPSGYQPVGDFGRRLVIRPQTPDRNNGPSNFDFWRFNGSGGPSLENRLEECDGRALDVGDDFQRVTTNLPRINDEIQDLINDDRDARWNNGRITNSDYEDWRSSPRVIKVAVYDPASIGQTRLEVTNVAVMFLESVSNADVITGRFMYYVNGTEGDEEDVEGSMVKHVRLVE